MAGILVAPPSPLATTLWSGIMVGTDADDAEFLISAEFAVAPKKFPNEDIFQRVLEDVANEITLVLSENIPNGGTDVEVGTNTPAVIVPETVGDATSPHTARPKFGLHVIWLAVPLTDVGLLIPA